MFSGIAMTRELSLGPLRLRINWLILACVLLSVSLFVRLGLWQVGRAEEKLAAQAEFELQQQQNPLPIENIEPQALTAASESLRDLHVSLYGEYDNQHAILLLAQFYETQIGYEVITPFRLRETGQLVLVSRGWTTGLLPPNTPPDLRPVSGVQRLTAQIHLPDANDRIIPSQINPDQWPLRIRSVEIPVLEMVLGESLFPYVVRLTADQPGTLVRHWEVVNVDINQHLSYAFQWFTFAGLTLLVALFLSSNLRQLMRDK